MGTGAALYALASKYWPSTRMVIGIKCALPSGVSSNKPSARGSLAAAAVRPTWAEAPMQHKAPQMTNHRAMRYNDDREGEALMDINDKAPEFTLPDQNGVPVSLKDFRGKYVVLYFYPRADTPGCT